MTIAGKDVRNRIIMTEMNPYSRTVAIDGPAASGKGTIGRRVAEGLRLPHLDTGMLYRFVGWQATAARVDDAAFAAGLAVKLDLKRLDDPQLVEILVSDAVSQLSSRVSVHPEVRAALLALQRDFAAQSGGAVLDGRDIGSVVCPTAAAKLYITASLEIRAERRFKQLQTVKKSLSYDSVLRSLRERDERDQNRAVAPLTIAEGAFVIDTGHRSVTEVRDMALSYIKTRF